MTEKFLFTLFLTCTGDAHGVFLDLYSRITWAEKANLFELTLDQNCYKYVNW